MENVKIYARTIEAEALEQVKAIQQSEAYKDCTICIMPDCHVGKGCTIGTVIEVKTK